MTTEQTNWDLVMEERSLNPSIKGETSKAKPRRLKENWFKTYAPEDQTGIDIGCGPDPLNETFRRYDIGDGDATYMEGVPNNIFHTVYASHVLEHLELPVLAVRRWLEILKPGGNLIIVVPHRDLYEKKRFTPSRWNEEHAYFWLPEEEDLPCTRSLKKVVREANHQARIIDMRVVDDGYNYSLDDVTHPVGEYAIECIVTKN